MFGLKMPTCSRKLSTVALCSDYCENCARERTHEGTYHCIVCFLKIFARVCLQDQVYEGQLLRNALHGQGTYKWGDSAVFEGGFYSNHKEGYAIVSYHNNSQFEGLFVENKPFGPGIFTYSNGRQDAGFWMGRKLVRLSRAADYIIPRLAPTSVAKIKLLQFRRLIPLDDSRDSANNVLERHKILSEYSSSPYSTLIHDARSFFFDKQLFERTYFATNGSLKTKFDGPNECQQKEDEDSAGERKDNQISGHRLCPQDLFDMKYIAQNEVDICEKGSSSDSQTGILYNLTKYGRMERLTKSSEQEDETEEFVSEGNEAEKSSNLPKIVSWNRSELCTEMLKQIFRFREFEDKLNFNLAKLMLGARTAFRRTGVREKECLHFLKMCSLGPVYEIKNLLCSYRISEELMDARGNNSLMFAAATDQLDIMDTLLDYGVDVNTFNDEGLTPLNLCLLRRLAQANKISNWEAAFLPKETDEALITEEYAQNDLLEGWESIPSLDRVFGDGTSMSDNKTLVVDNRFPSPITSSSLAKTDHDDFGNNSTRSQITILNIFKSPKTYPDDCSEDVSRMVFSSRSQVATDRSKPFTTFESMPKGDIRAIPKSIKREEFEKSIAKASASDKYLFEFSFEKPPVAVLSLKKKTDSANSTATKAKGKKEEAVREKEEVEEAPDLELMAKIQEIDKTIEKLLNRGADPNISEVPKPSIHLGLYTKDVALVRLLLMHGANPDSQLYPNEGLLTPLHVLVLLPSSPQFVRICELLLSFGANVEEQTLPEFSICEEEKDFLSDEEGRTPLQLLCMRPDVEYADPNENLIRIALMLAKVSNKKHCYNGHSYLTLAMHFGNLKLLKALLSNYFDPNGLLGKDLGTALHVLVSTEFQKKTLYETSIKTCDILLEAGADPLREFSVPAKLFGTCVDYGYREIEAEKDARKAAAVGKKGDKSGKERSEGSRGEKPGKEKGGGRDHLKDHIKVVEYLKEVARKMKSGEPYSETKYKENENSKRVRKPSEDSRRVTLSKGSGRSDSEKKDKTTTKEEIVEKEKSADILVESKSQEEKKDLRKASAEKKKKTEEVEYEKENKESWQKEVEETETKKSHRKGKDNEKDEKKSKIKAEKGKQEKKLKDKQLKGKKDSLEVTVKKESNLLKEKTKTSTKSLGQKARSETFPEKIRQNLLRMFGACANIDVNELLLPYVVLRDGELYYRFQDRGTGQKEQYSLI